MKLFHVTLVILFFSSLYGVYAGSSPEASEESYSPGFLLVKSSDLSENGIRTLAYAHAAINATVVRDYGQEGFPGLELVRLPDVLAVQEGVTYYEDLPSVEYVEPDYYRSPADIPSDPEFWRQWGLHNTGQVYRENVSPGIPGADVRITDIWDTGSNRTIVAVLDSGVDYNHPDLAANIWTDPVFGTHGYDTITGTLDPMDQRDHGTHCAGIIGAEVNNGIGGCGAGRKVSIMPVRWLGADGWGRVSDEISGILWAARHGATIISCSFRQVNPSRAEAEVIQNTDALFIIAAGNFGIDMNIMPDYPACYDFTSIITVASTTANDSLADFSNYGNKTVHLGAPGVDIYSTIRSEYQIHPLWIESFDTLSNWTTGINWTADTLNYTSAPAAVRGVVQDNLDETGSEQIVLTQKSGFMNLSGVSSPVISFKARQIDTNVYLEIFSLVNGVHWERLDTYQNEIDENFGIRQARIPDNLSESLVMVRFVAEGNGECTIDDLMLSDGYGTLQKGRWDYMNGTSMAAPMVAGVAALLKSSVPSASLAEIRSAILYSTDPIPDLEDRTVTGGRINATAALQRLREGSDFIPVNSGWNHLSVYRGLAPGSDTASIFAGLNSSGHSVMMYLNDTAGYRALNRADMIYPLQGYWIFSVNNTSVPVRFTDPGIEPVRNLTSGWSSVGGWSGEPIPANRTFQSLQNAWSYAVGYDPSLQRYEEPIFRDGSGNLSTNRSILPYRGYWLYCSQNGTYRDDYQ